MLLFLPHHYQAIIVMSKKMGGICSVLFAIPEGEYAIRNIIRD